MIPKKCLALCFSILVLLPAISYGGLSVQGWMRSDGVTGRPATTPHRWDREIVYISPVGISGVGAGFRMLATEPGWFLLQPQAQLFPEGTYAIFTTNMGNIDGGSTGFDYREQFINIPAGTAKVEGVEFRTHAHYSVMYDRSYTEWSMEPWFWGADIYQTFIATDAHVTRVATKLAGKNGDHYSMTLNFAIYETNAGAPSTWTKISPTRTRFLPGTMDPIIHIMDVNYLSNEVNLVVGREYALRLWIAPGSQSTSMAIVARPDSGSGYAGGKAYIGDAPNSAWDIYAYITGGAPETVVNFGPTSQDNPITATLLGWRNKQGQTFRASGTGLAGVELMYTVGCDPNPTIPVSITAYDGVGGPQIGYKKVCYSATDLCQGRVAAFWSEGEVPLVPGNEYYIEFDATSAGGINVYGLSNNIPNAQAYIGGAPTGGTDLPLTIAEYVALETPTPDPNATDTPTRTPTFTPTLSPTPITATNLLRNPAMEDGPEGTNGEAPDHWTKWTGSGTPAFWHCLDCGRSGLGARVIGGAINGNQFDAGWYQQVTGLVPGQAYALTGYVNIVPGPTANYQSWLGFDLTGQTASGLAGSVQYTSVGTVGGYSAIPLITFEATGTSISVWLRGRNTSTADVFYVDFDDMFLYEIGAVLPTSTPTNTPTNPNTSTPTNTPTVGGPDMDGDQIPDALEQISPDSGRTNRWLRDSDGDGLHDGEEDANRNGVRDAGETDARDRDSDDDGWIDGLDPAPLNGANPGTATDADADEAPFGLDLNDGDADLDNDRYKDGYEATVLNMGAVVDPNTRPALGDINKDGFVSNVDALAAQSLFLGTIGPDSPAFGGDGFINSDTNRDGFISNVDALVIQSFFLETVALLPL